MNSDPPDMKTCTRCKQTLPTTEFRERTKGSGKFFSWCRSCVSEYDRIRYQLPGVKEHKNECKMIRYQLPGVKEHKNEYMKIYRQKPGVKDREKIRQQQPEAKEKAYKRKKIYMQAPEAKDNWKKWWKTYYSRPEIKYKYITKSAIRRSRILQVEHDLTAKDWRAIQKAFKNKCAYCQCEGDLTMDHVIPISKGGPHTMNNVVPACFSCNCRKHNLDLHEALKRMGIPRRIFAGRLWRARRELAGDTDPKLGETDGDTQQEATDGAQSIRQERRSNTG